MMNIKVLCGLAAVIFLAGCAKKEDEDYVLREQQALDAWMRVNQPQAERQDNGMYVEWLRRTTVAIAPMTPGEDWMSLDYIVHDLSGNVIGMRSEEVAHHEGTFTRITHYGPHFAKFDPLLAHFTAGEYNILAEMKPNDSVRIYLPPPLAYSTARITFGNGYEGWRYSAFNPMNSSSGLTISGRPVVIDLALREIVKDPKVKELDEVEAYAAEKGLELVSDTIPGLYYEYIDEDLDSAIIPVDSTVYVSYATRFLDGKLIATNNKTAAYTEWGLFGDLFPNIETFTASVSSLIKGSAALSTAVKHELVRYNSGLRFVFISDLGYGASGLAASSGTTSTPPNPVIYPYTPFIFEVTTLPEDYDPDSEEEE